MLRSHSSCAQPAPVSLQSVGRSSQAAPPLTAGLLGASAKTVRAVCVPSPPPARRLVRFSQWGGLMMAACSAPAAGPRSRTGGVVHATWALTERERWLTGVTNDGPRAVGVKSMLAENLL